MHLRNVGVRISFTANISILDGAMLESTTTESYLLSAMEESRRRRPELSPPLSDWARRRACGVFCELRRFAWAWAWVCAVSLAARVPWPKVLGLNWCFEVADDEALDDLEEPRDDVECPPSESP